MVIFVPCVGTAATSRYVECNKFNRADICLDKNLMNSDGKIAGVRSIVFRNESVFHDVIFAPDGFFTARRYINEAGRSLKKQLTISISPQGFVGVNLGTNERFSPNPNYRNFSPTLRAYFLQLPEWKRKKIQVNLKLLELYSTKIDGLWGPNTLKALIGYSALFRQSFKFDTAYEVTKLTQAISEHRRFDYKNGFVGTAGSVAKLPCGTSSLSRCSPIQLCERGTIKGSSAGRQRWYTLGPGAIYAAEARKRRLMCGVEPAKTASANWCSPSNTKVCSNTVVCNGATASGPGKKWNDGSSTGRKWVAEARKRKLACGITKPIVSASSAPKCENDPASCGVVGLCKRGSELIDGKRAWRTDAYGQRYADAAREVGLSCQVEKVADKTYRVANGTGFYVTLDGYVVTNEHVIDGCSEVQVHNAGKLSAATVVSKDKINDLALLKVTNTVDAKFDLAPKNPYLLQNIIAAGFPFGEAVSSTIKVTQGVVSSLSGLGDNSGQIQIDAALQPGNSGGPVIDRNNGNVVGVAVAKLDTETSLENFGVIPENVNFGIKLSNLRTFLDDNQVNYDVGSQRTIEQQALGELAQNATVLLSCWMTKASIQQMQNQKVMFKSMQE